MTTRTASLITEEAADLPEVVVTRVRMVCDKTRYSVDCQLAAGQEVRLEDAQGRVHASDHNASSVPRPTKLTRVLSSNHGLIATVHQRSS